MRYFVLFLLLFSPPLFAVDQTAASCSLADVTTAYAGTSAGGTLTIPACAATQWAGTLTVAKAITITGAGIDATTIQYVATSPLIQISLEADVAVRITGITFDMVSNLGSPDRSGIYIDGNLTNSFGLTQLRIDHCKFIKGKRQIKTRGWVEGLIDHCYFLNGNISVGMAGDNNYAWGRTIEAGSSAALFIEANDFVITNATEMVPNHLIYHQEGARSVVRYNSFDATAYTNGGAYFFDQHGNQNYYSGTGDFRGQPINEVYRNIFHAYKYDTTAWFQIRSGSVLIHDNTIIADSGTAKTIRLYEEEGFTGISAFTPLRTEWPAQDQITNSFFWANTLNGVAMTDTYHSGHASDDVFIQKDRDYFMHAPQNSGGKSTYTGRVGGSTTAPTESDTGNLAFSAVGANAYFPYTEFTYPHPSLGGGGGDVTAPVLSAIGSNPTLSGSTVTWTTDENSDSQVDYGLTAAYGSSVAMVSPLVTSHSMTISGLSSGTLYHFRVLSRDAAGNLATGSDNTFGTAAISRFRLRR